MKTPLGRDIGLTEQEYLDESQKLYSSLLAQPSRRSFWVFLGLALVFHGVAFQVHFKTAPPDQGGSIRVCGLPHLVQRPILPAMRMPKHPVKIGHKSLAIPVPDPDPEEPVPLIEPEVLPVPIRLDLYGIFPTYTVASSWPSGFIPAKQDHVVVPSFPAAAIVAGIREVKVKVLLNVGANGKVNDVVWLEGLKVYKPSVLEAMYQWTFEPALKGGQPVESTWAQAFVFRLE